MIQRCLPAAAVWCHLFVSATLHCPADDWPRFRGPAGDGHADAADLPLHWDESTNIAWKTAVPGEGWSSPVVADGKVYVTAAVPIDPALGDDSDLSLRLLGFAAATGERSLDVEVFQQHADTAPRIHMKNSHASPTPIVDGGRVFVHFGHQGTACVGTDGHVIWQNRSLQYPPVHGNGGSPILVDDLLIFSCDGGRDPFVVALDAATGDIRWRTPRSTAATKKFSFSTPALIEIDGRRQVISPGSDVVCAYDPATGRELWRVRYDGYSVIPKPVFGHGLIFLSTGYDSPSVLAIRPGGSGDLTDTNIVWQMKKGAPHTPSPLLVGDELYLISDRGIATCADARTGEVHWQERIGGAYSASPIYADGRIYLQSEEGLGTVLRAGKQFELLAENPIGQRTLASYAIDGNAILLRGESDLFRIEEK